jgi:hypothetical protein
MSLPAYRPRIDRPEVLVANPVSLSSPDIDGVIWRCLKLNLWGKRRRPSRDNKEILGWVRAKKHRVNEVESLQLPVQK